jgi:ubiquinone/menaquinone biosynthesis C-methylase UbiE
MADQAAAFAGTIPAQYDAKLGPMLFEPYAREIASRIPAAASRVLEIAAGTGIVSRHLLDRLGPASTLVVTDLQPGMLDVAAHKIGQDPRVDIRRADALALPFGPQEFDVVVCQFGLMFFADPVAGLREARRVLTFDGVLLLSTWGSLEDNPVGRIAYEAVSQVLKDAPAFLVKPFSMHDTAAVTDLLHRAGFTYVQAASVELVAESPSAYAAAMGMLCGSPTFTQLQERGIEDPRGLVDAVSARLAREGGFAPMRLPMQAHVFTAQ